MLHVNPSLSSRPTEPEVARFDFAVIGGGIAGVSCSEMLGHLADDCDLNILLISASSLIKAAVTVQQRGYTMESMEVKETASSQIMDRFPNVKVITGVAEIVNTAEKLIHIKTYDKGQIVVSYHMICIATGGIPKALCQSNEYVLSIRDTESVKEFQIKLKDSERIVVVGNGGIATELVYEVKSCQVVWCVRHESISAAFFDASAAQFFLPHLQDENTDKDRISKRWVYTTDVQGTAGTAEYRGNALGPDWAHHLTLSGTAGDRQSEKVHLECQVEIKHILTPTHFTSLRKNEATNSDKDWPIYVELTNGKVFGADLIVNATGVEPSLNISLNGASIDCSDDDHGIIIDIEMRTNIADVYAAGDVVSASRWGHSSLWHQMRLWTQAKQMGAYAGQCMFSHLKKQPVHMDFCFEIFNHVTEFFGFRVVLLGLYNAQGLDNNDYSVLIRCTKGKEYIKVILKEHRVIGAVLIGETDLEETIENLILNQLDVSHIEDQLLEPDIDIDDYFD